MEQQPFALKFHSKAAASHSGRSSGGVVIKTRIKTEEIKPMVDEVVQGMLQPARESLPLQVNG